MELESIQTHDSKGNSGLGGGPFLTMMKITGRAHEGKRKQQCVLRLAKLELPVKPPKGLSGRPRGRESHRSTKDTSVVVSGTRW